MTTVTEPSSFTHGQPGSHWESNPGHLGCAVGALPLCYATTGQPPVLTIILYMYCTGGTEMPQSHTWQPLRMCCQHSVRG